MSYVGKINHINMAAEQVFKLFLQSKEARGMLLRLQREKFHKKIDFQIFTVGVLLTQARTVQPQVFHLILPADIGNFLAIISFGVDHHFAIEEPIFGL